MALTETLVRVVAAEIMAGGEGLAEILKAMTLMIVAMVAVVCDSNGGFDDGNWGRGDGGGSCGDGGGRVAVVVMALAAVVTVAAVVMAQLW